MEKVNFKIVGRRIKEKRKQLNMTQEKMCEDLGITTYFLSRIENGKANPSLSLTSEICFYLNFHIVELLSDINKEAPTYLESEVNEKLNRLDASHKEMVLDLIDSMLKHCR